MKTIISITLLSVFSFVLTSFYSQNPAISFEKALSEKKIEIVIQPTGGYSGNCISIQIKNLTNGKINLEMAPGTIFVPEDEGEQTLITTKDELLVLNKSEVRNFAVSAYCTEASDACPSKDSKFKIAQTQNSALKKLVYFIDSLKTPDDQLIQQSIWCVTDSENVAGVYTEDPKVTKALRGYVCALTGQKDTWYTTRRQVSVDANNRIVNVAKEVKGEISFQTTETVELQGVIQDSLGNVMYTNPNKINCPPGKIRFEFKLKVEGWKPGNYSVVYTNNGKEMLRQPFSF
jgi:hypothetical protein